MSERRRRLLRLARDLGPPFVLDVVVLHGTASWYVYLREAGPLLPLTLAALMRWRRFDRLIPVRLFYFAVACLYLDAVAVGLYPLWCVSVPWFAAAIATIPVAAATLGRRAAGLVRGAAHSAVPANVLAVLLVSMANRVPARPECERVLADPAIEILADTGAASPSRGNPRYLIARPQRDDFLIAYRVPMGTDVQVFADRLDPRTGELTPIDLPGEAIGLYYDAPRDQTIAVTFSQGDPAQPKLLHVLDSAMRSRKVIPVPREGWLGWDDYNAYMFPWDGQIGIQSDTTYQFDPVKLELKHAPEQLFPRCDLLSETGFQFGPGPRFWIAGGGGPLEYTLGRTAAVCSWDLATHQIRTYRSGMLGAWDVAVAAERHEVLATSFWRSKIWVADSETLEYKRTLDVAPCVRPIAYDAARGVGLTVECFTGDLLTFDVETGAIRERRYIGQNARKIDVVDGLGTVVLSGCGVFRLR